MCEGIFPQGWILQSMSLHLLDSDQLLAAEKVLFFLFDLLFFTTADTAYFALCAVEVDHCLLCFSADRTAKQVCFSTRWDLVGSSE
jgi:hypothetical protein